MNNTQEIKFLGDNLIKFEDHKEAILAALHSNPTNVSEPVTLLD